MTKMLSLAFDGITSLSIKPIRIITALGTVIAGLSFLGVIWSIVMRFMGNVVAGWIEHDMYYLLDWRSAAGLSRDFR